MNRVEGDLEVKVEVENGRVVDAWAMGTLYRGFERMMVGRGPLDGLVITPRICGICSVSHLLAAARALDVICGVEAPANGRIIRHLALAVEKIQSDVRHTILMFAADLVNPLYAGDRQYSETRARYEPYRGSSVVGAIRATRHLPGIISIVGGQWPHSSFIVPGGITSQPTAADLRRCARILHRFCRWYEEQILGCTIRRWQQVKSLDDLDRWFDESPDHGRGDLGFLVSRCRTLGLDAMGGGHDNYLALDRHDPGSGNAAAQRQGGFLCRGTKKTFNHEDVSEEIRYSRYEGRPEGNHPMLTSTHPTRTADRGKYSWCKAPRYTSQPAETGPLAEVLLGGDRLYADMVARRGVSVLARVMARLTRPARLLPLMEQWLHSIKPDGAFRRSCCVPAEGEGVGLVQAPRGMLGHWVQLSGGVIEHYQVIPPTTWNASPRDSEDVRGPIEEALVGTPIRDPDNPVEIGHVVRSFDPCMVCSVHAVTRSGAPLGKVRLGF
jgi:hydrogenase large subunit